MTDSDGGSRGTCFMDTKRVENDIIEFSVSSVGAQMCCPNILSSLFWVLKTEGKCQMWYKVLILY